MSFVPPSHSFAWEFSFVQHRVLIFFFFFFFFKFGWVFFFLLFFFFFFLRYAPLGAYTPPRRWVRFFLLFPHWVAGVYYSCFCNCLLKYIPFFFSFSGLLDVPRVNHRAVGRTGGPR